MSALCKAASILTELFQCIQLLHRFTVGCYFVTKCTCSDPRAPPCVARQAWAQPMPVPCNQDRDCNREASTGKCQGVRHEQHTSSYEWKEITYKLIYAAIVGHIDNRCPPSCDHDRG